MVGGLNKMKWIKKPQNYFLIYWFGSNQIKLCLVSQSIGVDYMDHFPPFCY